MAHDVSPHLELKDVADSEQQGRFDSVQFNSFSMREGFTDKMTIFEFVEQLCDIIGGDDAYYRFSKEELIEMCKEMSESHRKVEEEIAEAV